jgi:integrase
MSNIGRGNPQIFYTQRNFDQRSTIGEVLVRHVSITHITNIIEPHWATKNETIDRVRNRIELVLDWATVRKLRTGDNPARWKGNLDKAGLADRKIVGAVTGHKALPSADLYAFVQALKSVPGTSARCLEFVILTACRSGEARMATWAEIDMATRTWSIPGARMKSGRAHNVPLSDDVVTLLEALPKMEGTELLFPGAKAGKPVVPEPAAEAKATVARFDYE